MEGGGGGECLGESGEAFEPFVVLVLGVLEQLGRLGRLFVPEASLSQDSIKGDY